MIGMLKRIYRRQAFNPSLIGVLINPFFVSRKGLYKCLSDNAHLVTGSVLDLGCGQKPYKELFSYSDYTGLEIDTDLNRKLAFADDFYDGNTLPYQDNLFDTILCNQVLEHVFEPDFFLSEIFRALKPGGLIILTVPFIWEEHEQPYDFGRYTSFGLDYSFRKSGFEVVNIEKITFGASAILQLFAGFLFSKVIHRGFIFRSLFIALLISPISFLGFLFTLRGQQNKSKNQNLYLDQLIVGRKPK